jgi:hypothetical protein
MKVFEQNDDFLVTNLNIISTSDSALWTDFHAELYGYLISLIKDNPKKLLHILSLFFNKYGSAQSSFIINNYISNLFDIYNEEYLISLLDDMGEKEPSVLRSIFVA